MLGPLAVAGALRIVVQPQAEPDALPLDIDLEHLDLDDLTGLDHLVRVGDEAVGHRRHVHQTVLVHADIHERAEGGHIRHHAFQHHADLEVGHLLDAGREGRGGERGTRVTARLLQFAQDVGHGGDAESFVGEVAGLERPQLAFVTDQFGEGDAGAVQDAPHHRVGLGVHARGVQRVVAFADAQEAGALFKGLGAQARNVEQAGAAAEWPGLVTVRHDRLGERFGHAGDLGQQRHRGRVEVDADGVHGVLDHRVEAAGQGSGRHVVLVLADTDGLRLDLDEFGERVLQATGDRDRAAQRDVQLGQLVSGIGRRRVHRGARLTDHGLGRQPLGAGRTRGLEVGDEFGCQRVGFAGCGAVTDGDQFDVVPRDEGGQRRLGVVPFVLGLMRVDGAGVDDLAGTVHHRDLHAGAEPGVEPECGARPRRRGQQQVLEVLGEHRDGVLLGALPQPDAGVDGGREHQLGAPGPADRGGQPRCRGAAGAHVDTERLRDHGLVQRLVAAVEVQRQCFFLLAAQHRQHAVGRHVLERLGVLEVVAELLRSRAFRRFLRPRLGGQGAVGPELLAHRADQFGVFRDPLHQDVARPVERGGDVGHLLTQELGGHVIGIERGVGEQPVRQGLQAGLASDLGLGAALGLVRQVDVFDPRLRLGGQQRRLEVVGQLALFFDRGQHGVAALIQFAQVPEPLLQGAELTVVQAAGDFLAVPRDERHRRAFVQQPYRGVDLTFGDGQLFGQAGVHGLDDRLDAQIHGLDPTQCCRQPSAAASKFALCLSRSRRRTRPGAPGSAT
ncbi:Uncharacterised protein [Mycobacteroides abscessus subsp. abscessus]|nr:Uncharacterised protein [Mycobacteroides abscessus subsp. abscessus]